MSQAVIGDFFDVTDNAIDEIALRLINSPSSEIFLIDPADCTLVRAKLKRLAAGSIKPNIEPPFSGGSFNCLFPEITKHPYLDRSVGRRGK